MAQFRAFPFFIKSAAMKYFNKHCNRSEVKKLWNKTFQLYKSFVDEAPDIGGKENNMSNNLYMALAIFAFYEAVDKKVTCEELRQMMTEYMPKNIPVISALLDFNKPKNQEKLKRRYEKYKALSDKKLDNGEWGNSSISNEFQTHTIGTAKRGTRQNIFDMAGNVREWCWDFYSNNTDGISNRTNGLSHHRHRRRTGHVNKT